MDSQKRLLLALALSFVLTAVYMAIFGSTPPEDLGADGGFADGGVLLDGGTAPAVAAVDADGGTAAGTNVEAPSIAAAPAEPPAELKQLTHDEEQLTYRLSTKSASLVAAEFKGEKMREQRPLSVSEGYRLLFGGEVPDAPQMDMATPPEGYPSALAVGVHGATPLDPWLVWRVDESASSGNRVVFTARQGVWEARKTLEWTQYDDKARPASWGYEAAMTLELKNVSAAPAQGELSIHYGRAVNPKTEEKASFFGGVGNESKATCYVTDEMHQRVADQEAPDAEKLKGPLYYVGVDQQYFLGAVFPLDKVRDGRCELHASPTARVAVGYYPITVQPGATHVEKFGVYVGPKDGDFLNQEPSPELLAAAGDPNPQRCVPTKRAIGADEYPCSVHLGKTVNFGIWEVLCLVLLAILKFFFGVFGNWGLAIVFLTLTVKVLLLPLTWKSMIAAENMKKLQPKMEEIRKKYAEDRERMNMEVMKLYQEAKVNPLGGCFPLLLQMPVWIALFTTLRNSYEIYREPFFGPVWTDLTYKDPTYIFPVLLGVTMIATQRLQPAMMDKAQQRIMTWFMPTLFTVMMLAYPAGLTLYIFTNNVLSIGQQYGLRKWLERTGRAAPKPAGGSTVDAKKK